MSRRKCCCPCNESNCKPRRDSGKTRCDSLQLIVPTGFVDKTGCTQVAPELCAVYVPGTYVLPTSGTSSPCVVPDEWILTFTSVPNCRCADAGTATVEFKIFQACEDDRCTVHVTVTVIDCNTGSGTGSRNVFEYIAFGPIDVKGGKSFVVPFNNTANGSFGARPCVDASYPAELTIKEV